VSFPYTP